MNNQLTENLFWFIELALRGEAALRSRLPKDARKNAAISPCERSMAEANLATAAAYLQNHTKEQNPLCEGDLLLQHTQKGKF